MDRLARRLATGAPLAEGEDAPPVETTDGRRVRAYLKTIMSATRGESAPTEKTLNERVAHYTRARQILGEQAEPARVLAQALVDSYCREFSSSGGPKPFLQSLGCRVGLLYPHFQGGAKRKRYRPSVPVLDMLARACVSAGETVTLSDFLERLWRRFGLIVGGRQDPEWDDAAFLSKCGLRVDTPELVENGERLVEELIAMGLARRFADGVTFVGDSR